MKPTPSQIYSIKTKFNEMNNKVDFLNLLNYSKEILYQEKCIPFSLKQLNFYISKDSKKKSFDKKVYHSFEIKKKSGANRVIHAPVKGLKEFQKTLNIILQCVYVPHKAATGFVMGKSIVENANQHAGKLYVYNIDLKEFFPSVDAARVWGRLLAKPFNLGRSNERKQIANMIKTLCCHSMPVERSIDGQWRMVQASVLPQGAPTSPILTNAICERLDIKLSGLAKRFNINYTRYADDITFSSNHNTYNLTTNEKETIFKRGSSFDRELRRIIKDQNFYLNESKVRLQKKGYRQEVTGLVVNDKINVSRNYIKNLRHWLYFWERFGYEKASILFTKKYLEDKGHNEKDKPNMAMVIEGKLLFLKMVKGEKDSTYSKLKERFDTLTTNNKYKQTSTSGNLVQENNGIYYSRKSLKTSNKINKQEIIDLIFERGLDEAMKLYSK